MNLKFYAKLDKEGYSIMNSVPEFKKTRLTAEELGGITSKFCVIMTSSGMIESVTPLDVDYVNHEALKAAHDYNYHETHNRYTTDFPDRPSIQDLRETTQEVIDRLEMYKGPFKDRLLSLLAEFPIEVENITGDGNIFRKATLPNLAMVA